MSERQRIGEERHNSGGWFARFVGYAVILASLALIAISILFFIFLWQTVPELLDLGWSLVESADALAEAVAQNGGGA